MPSSSYQPITVSTMPHRLCDLAYIKRQPPSILGDKRREVIYEDLAQALLLRGHSCLQVLSESEAERQRFGRLLSNEQVSAPSLIDYACTRSITKPTIGDPVAELLVLSDGSNNGFSSANGKVTAAGGKLGVINGNVARGLMLHASLAVRADTEQVIGLSDAIVFNRAKKPEGVSRHHACSDWKRGDKQLQREDKESHAIEQGAYNSRYVLNSCGYKKLVYVHDAGGDDKTAISKLVELKSPQSDTDQSDDFVIRLRNFKRYFYQGPRKGDEPGLSNDYWLDARLKRTSKGNQLDKKHLGELLESASFLPQSLSVEIRELKHLSKKIKKRRRKKRTARAQIRSVSIRFCDLMGRWHQLNLVQIKENPMDLPKGERKTAINWVLITSLPAETMEQILRIVRYYRNRWHIEQLFRVVKRDALGIEKTQLSKVSAIIKLLVMSLETAATVLKLVQARDQYEGNPITEVFTEQQVAILKLVTKEYEGRTKKQKNPFPEDQLSYATWTIARMGGWKVYGTRPPGPKTIARGLKDFTRFADLTIRINDSNDELLL